MISRAILYSPAARCCALLALAAPLLAQTTAPGFHYAETNFLAAQRQFRAQPTNAIPFAAAAFDRAEFATNDTERAALATAAIAPLREFLSRQPKSAAAHYYLAMNLGQLARTKTLGALRLVDEMEIEFKTAITLDPHLDHAGPDRNLGQLYFQAPGWPASVGSNSKARKHLDHAVELAPDFPDNHLCLLEAAVSWRDKKILTRELAGLQTNWPSAQTNYSGVAWDAAWHDWEKRRTDFTARARLILAK
ncbi:MAG: hypothetical protein RLZZ350_2151 [Verrucomicrobiota bacterium]|jgi:hypothetical protein